MQHVVFLSHSSLRRDSAIARRIRSVLEQKGVSCWAAETDISPGMSYVDSIGAAIAAASVFVLVLPTGYSPRIERELQLAMTRGISIVPVRLDPAPLSPGMEHLVGSLQQIDWSDTHPDSALVGIFDAVVSQLPGDFQPSGPIETPSEPKSKGYVFISYVRTDADFILKLAQVLREPGYAYWEYLEGERDYHGALYRELESRIEESAAFFTIVSDSWRDSGWAAAEYIFAREIGIPIFVIQASKLQKPMPILLNLQTRIDMSVDFERGAEILRQELAKKGL